MDEIQMGRQIDVDIETEMKKSYLDYSMSVIVGRALPDVRDGLKPVHRRILYTLYENGIYPDKAYRKCADTVGNVLGKYHPHGDASVYDAMVRMAQDFSLRYPLVDGHGNFGSIDGDPAAAYRYTESRMSKISMYMLTDIEKDTVDFTPNYDDRLKEPVVLPSKYPNLLVNGSTGIAVGMATNIPPHNLGEVTRAVCALIDNPEISLDEIMAYIPGPDFPTGGTIMGRSGIRAAYGTGRGKIKLRAKAHIEDMENGRERIVVTEIPYGVNKARLIESIADLVKNKRIEMISHIRDESDRDGMRVVIELKRDANASVCLNQLYSFTQMQETVGVIMLALDKGEPKILTLKEILEKYVEFQEEVVVRRTKFDLNKASNRAHILEGLQRAVDIVDEIIATIRATDGTSTDAKNAIMEKFGFDDVQAAAIVAFRLGQLAGLEIEKIMNELDELHAKIKEYNEILASPARQLAIVKEECSAIGKKYSDERRTDIEAVSGEVDIEDLIPQTDCVITMTHFGYVKRMPADTYKAQRRGGRGIMGMTRREEDFVTDLFFSSSHDYILFFTDKGKMHRIKAYEISEASRVGKGVNIVNLLNLEQGEKVTSTMQISDIEEDIYLSMVTKKGIIKRCALSNFKNVRKTGLIAINLDEDDLLSFVVKTKGDDELMVATKSGRCVRFKEEEARELGRTARGVKAVSLEGDDYVVGVEVVDDSKTLLTVSEDGQGRRSEFSEYPAKSRGTKGVKNYYTDKHGMVAAVKAVADDEDVVIIADDGVIIRIPATQINIQSRYASGVIVMRLAEGSSVVAIEAVPHEEEEEENSDEVMEADMEAEADFEE